MALTPGEMKVLMAMVQKARKPKFESQYRAWATKMQPPFQGKP